ncbi:MAG: hypothetical protein LBQ87_07615 [Candidatus Fibromonas sp.]|jgi:hypothetical protein|nr:hypothetical protein [Candidatus Fibromonas sp.]
MFRVFFFALALTLVFAKDWVHFTRQNDVRDAVLADDGTLWAAFAWGLQERLKNGTEISYMPGSDGLEAADFVQLFALPGGDVIAVSKNGTLVRKNKNSKNFKTVSTSYAEKKRNVLQGLGERNGNILFLPFEDALAFFDYEQNRSILTISQIEKNSLGGNLVIKRILVEKDSIWVDLGTEVWGGEIDWNKMADPSFWKRLDKKLPEKSRPGYIPKNSDFPLEKIRIISVLSGGGTLAWGNDFDLISRMQNEQWENPFQANQSGYPDDQKTWPAKSLAVLPNGNFAIGMWQAGLITYTPELKSKWFHSNTSSDICPTKYTSSNEDGNTIVRGVIALPDFSGFLFSFVSQTNYGLGFVDKNGGSHCVKRNNASSSVASSVIGRENETGEWEIYVAWESSLASKNGGVDFYSLNPPQSSENFSPELRKKWQFSFGSPIDFAFDSKGILWAVSSSKIFYLDREEDEWKEPDYIRGFNGGTISALETDAQNGLWIGTGDGAYFISQVNNSPGNLTAKRFRIRDGLLNEAIYDIAIDTIKGRVYFAHDLGLSVYSTALVRNSSGYMQDGSPKTIAYPNPFRPALHGAVKIDYISEKSSVYIFDSSGKRVRLFSGNDLRGGAVVWDGTNEGGKPVAPGLYHYLATTGKKAVKGKIIVER